MKIAIASPLASTSRPQYGTETVVVNLARELANQGHRIHLLIRPERGVTPNVPGMSKAVQSVRLDASHKRTLARAIARYAHERQPDILFSVARRDNLALCWAKPHLPPCMPAVISEHLAIGDSLRDYNAVKRWQRTHMMRRAYRHADAIVAVSQGIAEELHSRLGLAESRIAVVYNPIVTDTLHRLAAETIDHAWFDPGQPPVILAVGRLDPHKDLPTLFLAFARLRETRPCRLFIIGEGAQRTELQRLAEQLGIAEDLEMAGFKSNPFAYMRRASLLALSSRVEGFGNVLVEALATGTPVVATDCPHGPREILGNGRFGALVPVHDAEALAQAMQSTLNRPFPGEVLARRAEDFSAPVVAQRYAQLFEGLIERRSRRARSTK